MYSITRQTITFSCLAVKDIPWCKKYLNCRTKEIVIIVIPLIYIHTIKQRGWFPVVSHISINEITKQALCSKPDLSTYQYRLVLFMRYMYTLSFTQSDMPTTYYGSQRLYLYNRKTIYLWPAKQYACIFKLTRIS